MRMKKPDGWYGFSHVDCELFSLGINDRGTNNMRPYSSQLYCKRKDRQGKNRPRWEGNKRLELLHCHWNVCPKLKEERRKQAQKDKR